MTSLPTDSVMIKLYHLGRTDREIATDYGVTVQAVNKRLVKLGLRRQPVVDRMNAGINSRWGQIKTRPGGFSHHNQHAVKMLKLFLRKNLGDELKPYQLKQVAGWEKQMQLGNKVLCYDPDLPAGWYYRPRRQEDGRRIMDWPAELPFPDEEFKRALDLPEAS